MKLQRVPIGVRIAVVLAVLVVTATTALVGRELVRDKPYNEFHSCACRGVVVGNYDVVQLGGRLDMRGICLGIPHACERCCSCL